MWNNFSAKIVHTAVGKACRRCDLDMPSSSNLFAVPTKWDAPAIAPPAAGLSRSTLQQFLLLANLKHQK